MIGLNMITVLPAQCDPSVLGLIFFKITELEPAHKAASFCQFLTPKNVTTLYHPPYSPDFSPSDYFLFPKLKMKLKGLHFAGFAEIQ